MFWLLITIIAYLLFALANVGDKLVVSKFKTEPIVYAFYVGVLGILTIILAPFGLMIPEPILIYWAFLAGISFVMTLLFMYKAINAGETTTAITIMGGSSPLFTLILSYLFLKERLLVSQWWSFVFLVLAIVIISWPLDKKNKKINHTQITWAIAAGLASGFSYVLAKYIYLAEPFISGFIWIRIGGFLTAMMFLLVPSYRQLIKKDWQKPKKKKGLLLTGIQIIGGLGVIGQNYAFSLASATLVNALQAVQYALIFILANLFGLKIPILKEKVNRTILIQKIVAIGLIAIGLYLLALQ